MRDVKRAQDLIGSDVYDREGDKIGRVGNVYVDDATHQPEWVTVRTGLFGTKESFVPLEGASTSEDSISVGVSRDKVKDSPRVDTEHGHLSDQEGQNLYSYYGIKRPSPAPPQQGQAQDGHRTRSRPSPAQMPGAQRPGTSGSPMTSSGGTNGSNHRKRSGPSGGPAGTARQSPSRMEQRPGRNTRQRHSADGHAPRRGTQRTEGMRGNSPGSQSMTEEQPRVETETVEAGRVRLRKYVVTEKESVTVALRREEVRIVREPISESEREQMPSPDAELGEEQEEIILYAERPVISKETVPVERVRLSTETITEEETAPGDVGKEKFDIRDETGRHQDEST